MPVKKQPSPAQLAARKKFAAMAKSGELMKKRKAVALKKKTGLKKPVAKKVVATKKTTKCETPSAANLKLKRLAYNSCGRLRPGWKVLKCGTLKFAGTAKKTPAKKGLNGVESKTLKIHKNYSKVKTLKDVAKHLKISNKKASEIKQKIENKINAPKYMVWGTGNQKGYSLSSFAKELKIDIEFI
jgi:hypothetical protein